MGFQKGHKLATGRPVGSVSPLTKSFREALTIAFNALQNDPNANLIEWGRNNPTAFYMVASKLIPTEVNHSLDNKVIRVVIPGESQIEDAEQIP